MEKKQSAMQHNFTHARLVTISATENPETAVRTGQVTVAADGVAPQQFTITQKLKPVSDIPGWGDNIPPA